MSNGPNGIKYTGTLAESQYGRQRSTSASPPPTKRARPFGMAGSDDEDDDADMPLVGMQSSTGSISKPIFRQPIGFATSSWGSVPVPINTYTEDVQVADGAAFLPGQLPPGRRDRSESPLPQPEDLYQPLPPAPGGKKPRGKPRPRKFDADFAQHTSRFKVHNFVHDASKEAIVPSTTRTKSQPKPKTKPNPNPVQTSALAPTSFGAANEPQYLPESVSHVNHGHEKGKERQLDINPERRRDAKRRKTDSASVRAGYTDGPSSSVAGASSLSTNTSTTWNSGGVLPSPAASRSASSASPTLRTSIAKPTPTARTPVNSGAAFWPGGKQPPPLRMVTLLIADIRSGIVDHQLAEIRIPLRAADQKADGWWADARALCEQLQGGPSRIEGPAKVYTLRGKYRQFFLRVGDDGENDVMQSNVRVAPERTIDIVVEAPAAKGALPPPPQIPRDLYSPSPELEDPTDNEGSHSSPSQTADSDGKTNRKDRRVAFQVESQRPAADNHLEQSQQSRRSLPGTKPEHDRRQAGRTTAARSVSPRSGKSASKPTASRSKLKPDALVIPSADLDNADAVQLSPRSKGYYELYAAKYSLPAPVPLAQRTPQYNLDYRVIFKAVIEYIRPVVEENGGFIKYSESLAGPDRIQNVLQQFRFVQAMTDMLVGDLTPEHWQNAPSEEITVEHIWKLLDIDPQQGIDGGETLKLLAWYGPDGTRQPNADIIKLLEENSKPPPGTVGHYKNFLRALRVADREWKKEQMESPEPSGPDDEDDPGQDG